MAGENLAGCSAVRCVCLDRSRQNFAWGSRAPNFSRHLIHGSHVPHWWVSWSQSVTPHVLRPAIAIAVFSLCCLPGSTTCAFCVQQHASDSPVTHSGGSDPWLVIVQRTGLPCFMPDRELHDRYLLDILVLVARAYVAEYLVDNMIFLHMILLLQCRES
jgi:hypothetical protein